jgi:putative Mn2+ efflux pump MntP
MDFSFAFFFSSILLGIGLAMDAFSVSLANGLNEPCMKKAKICSIAGIFAFFQALMPFIGWVLIKTVISYFETLEKFIPWVALAILGYIGGKMIYESIKGGECNDSCGCEKLTLRALIIQGVATSIDALSAGLDFAEYDLWGALLAALIIAVVTFCICLAGIILGKKFGTKLAGKAGILGGAILIFIGIEIFITGVFF